MRAVGATGATGDTHVAPGRGLAYAKVGATTRRTTGPLQGRKGTAGVTGAAGRAAMPAQAKPGDSLQIQPSRSALPRGRTTYGYFLGLT